MMYDDLSMPEKVAILLIQLGEDVTTLLFSHMEVDVITEISRYIATAKSMDKSVAAAILRYHAVKPIYEKRRLRIRERNFIPHFRSGNRAKDPR